MVTYSEWNLISALFLRNKIKFDCINMYNPVKKRKVTCILSIQHFDLCILNRFKEITYSDQSNSGKSFRVSTKIIGKQPREIAFKTNAYLRAENLILHSL